MHSNNLRAAMFMVISMAGFSVNDAITKTLFDDMSMAQILAVRGLMATALIAAYAAWDGALAKWRLAMHPMMAIRVMGEAGGALTFFLALKEMPLPNVSAILQALPLAVTMGAALVFNEPVGWRRWLAILAGFAGVLIIVRPGYEGFNSAALWGVACVALCAARDLATKRLPANVPSLLVSTATSACVTVLGFLLIAPLGGWNPVSTSNYAMIALASVLLLFGYQFIILAMRLGDISFVAPFRYTALIWAMALGFLIFGNVPDGPMIVGSVLVVASGLYALYRERVRHRLVSASSVSPQMAPDGL
ncbi:MAG: DMT family transporter [Rhizobiaceae bacterium]